MDQTRLRDQARQRSRDGAGAPGRSGRVRGVLREEDGALLHARARRQGRVRGGARAGRRDAAPAVPGRDGRRVVGAGHRMDFTVDLRHMHLIDPETNRVIGHRNDDTASTSN